MANGSGCLSAGPTLYRRGEIGSGRGADRLVPLFAQAVLQSGVRQHNNRIRGLARRARWRLSPRRSLGAPRKSFSSPRVRSGIAAALSISVASGCFGYSTGWAELAGFPPGTNDRKPIGSTFRLSNGCSRLLAPELPEQLLAAPRGEYQNSSELARAAGVSVMSAFRFVQQIQDEGYLHESASHLKLVRRQDLFNRWKAVGRRGANEMPMRLLLKGDPLSPFRKVPSEQRWCLALFAAADALKLGHVQSIPRYIYLPQVPPPVPAVWKNLRPCSPGEPPDLIFRQAPAPASIFRGAVQADGMPVSDVLQIWIDVAGHPSRGAEQADLIQTCARPRD